MTENEPIGSLLVKALFIDKEALNKALATQRKTYAPLGRILRDEAGVTDEMLAQALAQQEIVPKITLRFFPVQDEAIKILEDDFCRQHEVMCFEKLGSTICIAFGNPNQKNLIRHIEKLTKMTVKVFKSPWEDIQRKLNRASR